VSTTQPETQSRTDERPGASDPVALPEYDVRRRRPPALSFLLRLETLRRVARVLSLLIIDAVGVLGALTTALALKLLIRGQFELRFAWHEARPWMPFAYLVTVLLFARADLYSDRPRRPGLSQIFTALVQATLISLVFALANGEHFSSYYVFYGSLAIGTFYIGGLRQLHTRVSGWLLEQAGYQRRALLIGSGRHLDQVAHAISDRAHTRVDLVGYISLSPSASNNGLLSLGTLENLSETLIAQRVQEVIIADPDFPQQKAIEIVDRCHQRGVTVHVAPSTMEILINRAEFVPGQSVPLFTLRPPAFQGLDFAVKRTFDLVLSTIGLLVLAPVLALIALAIKLSSRGPVIYCSVRPGMGLQPFNCFKFRTMRENADEDQAELEQLNEQTGALFKIRDDPRMTRVGRALRRFSLDELPQLANVIRGEMSLVGPRPLPMRDFLLLEEWHKKRYHVLPGITGLWQVSGRSELDFDDLVRLDFVYLERWSVALDLMILIKTLPAVLGHRGAF
jgi:exopolysaccharide biosynthesis polyprenyl glycosylphosphotransferase